MSASISTKESSIAIKALGASARTIKGGMISFISSSMPEATSTLSEAKSTIDEVRSTFSSSNRTIVPLMRTIKNQYGFKGIKKWFDQKEDEFDDDDFSSNFTWDDEVEGETATLAELSESEKSANKISKAVVESSNQLVEAQIASLSNMTDLMNKQTAAITSGFDQTHAILNKILEVVTTNTSALIKSSVISNESKEDERTKSLKKGKFDLKSYKKILSKNFEESEFGAVAAFLPLFQDPDNLKNLLPSYGEIFQGLIAGGMKKAFPNVNRNLKALDDAVSTTIQESLIRLGEDKGRFGTKGLLANLFGIDGKRENTDTNRSKLELKSVPYDSISKEALTAAIPGYLRKILVALGGPDLIYDYKSRKFSGRASVESQYRSKSARTGSINNASDRIRKSLAGDEFTSLTYDLMMNSIGANIGDNASGFIESFNDPLVLKSFLLGLYDGNVDEKGLKKITAMSKRLSGINNKDLRKDLILQASKQNAVRNSETSEFVKMMDEYGTDLSFIKDSYLEDSKYIKSMYMRDRNKPEPEPWPTSDIHQGESIGTLVNSMNYTNIALYEIYRKLETGINVFQVGSKKSRSKAFERLDMIKEPEKYNSKSIPASSTISINENTVIPGGNPNDPYDDDYENPLMNNEGEDLSGSERGWRWFKQRGSQFKNAILNGSPEQVQRVFRDGIHDISGVAGKGFKSLGSKVNASHGNAFGWARHKLTGKGYQYQSGTDQDGNPIITSIGDNEKGGLFGFMKDNINDMFKDSKSKLNGWTQKVMRNFDYGDKSNDPEEKKLASKRKKLLGMSVGAFAGAGLLGGPIGLIAGGLAGSALSTSNLGSKLQNKLFGKGDEKGKGKGLFTKIGDKLVRPFEYQASKTFSHIGGVIEKSVVGPISDIGLAMADRAKETVDSAFHSLMSKISGAIHEHVIDPMKEKFGKAKDWVKDKVSSVWEKLPHPIRDRWRVHKENNPGGIIAGISRGAASLAGVIPQAGLNGIANSVAGGKGIFGKRAVHSRDENGNIIYTSDVIKQRRKERAERIKNERAQFNDGGYKGFFARKDAERAAKGKRNLSDYTGETKTEQNTSEISKSTEQMAETLKEQSADQKKFNDLAAESHKRMQTPGSIYTHDTHIEEYAKQIIQMMGGNRSNNKGGFKYGNSEVTNDNDFANSALSTAATIGISGDDFSNEEATNVSNIIDEASKPNSSRSKISQKLKNLMGIQKIERREAGEEKKSLFSKLFDGLGSILDNLPGLAAAAVGLYALIKDPQGVFDVLKNISNGIGGIIEFFSGKSDKNAVTTGANAVTSVLDTQVDDILDYATPGAKLNRNDTDAAGNNITNVAATNAKEELLWKTQARASLTGTQSAYSGLNRVLSNRDARRAARYDRRSQRAWTNRGRRRNAERAENASARSQEFARRADDPASSSFTSSIGRNVERVGAMYVASGAVGGIAKTGAKLFGASDGTAAKIGDIGSMTTSAALTANVMSSAVKGKKSWIDMMVDAAEKFFDEFVKLLKSNPTVNKLFAKIGGSKAGELASKAASKVAGMAKGVVSAIKAKTTDKIAALLEKKLAAMGVKDAGAVASLGVGVIVGAVAGLLDGLCSAEHLFMIAPGDANAGMIAISGIMSAIMGALSWVPIANIIVLVIDIIDMILQMVPTIGMGLTQMIAQGIYSIFDKDGLQAKQAEFSNLNNSYNEKWGTSLSTGDFNDAVNRTGFFDKIWNGSQAYEYDENGNRIGYKTDKAGGFLNSGYGIKNWFVGQEKDYITGDDGKALINSDGKAVELLDKYGRNKKVDKKWGDYVGDAFGNVGRFFFGGKTYEVDENGNAKIDENNNYIEGEREGNIFQKLGWTKEGDGFLKSTTKVAGKLTQTLLNPLTLVTDALNEYDKSRYELDANGDPILDEDGNPVKKNDFASFAIKAMGKINDFVSNPFKAIIDGITGAEEKEDGKVTKRDKGFWAGVMEGLTKLGKSQIKTSDVLNGMGGPASSYAATSGSQISESGSNIPSYAAASGVNTSGGNKLTSVSSGNIASTVVNVGQSSLGMASNSKAGGNPLSVPYKITNEFGKDRLNRGGHQGIDIVPVDGLSTDNVKVGSRFAGTVVKVKNNVSDDDTARQTPNGDWYYQGRNDTGNMVVIKTDDGFTIKSMHLKSGSIPENIKEGARINIGDVIGTMGNTGYSTAPHLHYQIEDAQGNPIDPTSSVQTFAALESPQSEISSGDSYVTASAASDSTSSTSSASGPLGQLLEALKNAGSAFLSKLTGGLIGGDYSSSTSNVSSSDTPAVSTVNGNSLSEAPSSVMISSAPNSQWVQIVRSVKEAVATQAPEYNQSGYIKLNAGGRTMNMRTDCSGLVGAMLKIYGAIPWDNNVTSSSLDRDGGIPQGFDRAAWPGWENLVEGDILVTGGNHVEVFAYNDGNNHMVYNGGSSKALKSPGATYTGHKSGYNSIWRCQESGAQIASTAATAGNIGAQSIVGSGDIGQNVAAAKVTGELDTWKYLKKLGYTDAAASGIMGVWAHESENKPNKMEGDFMRSFPGFENVLKSNETLDNYALNTLFPATEKNVKINREAYMADGHYYPGIGLAQWTGPRAKQLFDYAKSKGMDWKNLDGQMEFFQHEMNSKVRKIGPSDLNSLSDPQEAAELFARKFEGTSESDWIAKRRNSAKQIYDLYANEGMGGPSQSTIGRSSYKTNNMLQQAASESTGMVNLPISMKRAPLAETRNISNITDMKEVVTLLYQVIKQLETISGNTGESNGLLNSINQKDFVDKGVRDSLNSFNKVGGRKNYTRHVTSNPNNNRLVSSMARP